MRLRLLLVVFGVLFPSISGAADSSPRELLTALNALTIDSQHVYTVATKDRVELRKASDFFHSTAAWSGRFKP